MTIGKRIKDLRESKGFTQKQLAEMLGVTAVTITRYEQNQREPNIDILGKMAKALDTTTAYLIYDENEFETFVKNFESFNGASIEKVQNALGKAFKDILSPKNISASLYEYLKLPSADVRTTIIDAYNELEKDMNKKQDVLISLGLSEIIIEQMTPSEIEEFFNFLKTSAKIKYQELIDKRKTDDSLPISDLNSDDK